MRRDRPRIYVEGLALEFSWADPTRSLTELIFDTVRAAVDDAAIDMGDIDSVVLSAHDLIDGRSLSSMVTAPAAGAYLRDETRISDDGAAAFVAAVTRLEAEHHNRSIIAAWGRASEHDVRAVSRSKFEPVFHRPIGLTELDISALRAQAWLMKYATDDDQANRGRTKAALRRSKLASRNERAAQEGHSAQECPTPLLPSEIALWADVVVALVLSREPTPVCVAGVGQSSEPYRIGDRDLLAMPALREAASRALMEAGVTGDELDLIELDGLTLFDEAIGLEATGVAQPGQGMHHLAEDLRCNPSGGSAAGYCAPAMGLVRIAETVWQIRGGGANQLSKVKRALATGSSTVAAQTQTAIVLESA